MSSLIFIKDRLGAITACVRGETLNVPADHQYYDRIIESLRSGDGVEAVRLADLGKSVATFVGGNGNIKVLDGVVYYKDAAIHNTVTKRIVDFMKQGLPVVPVVLFLENLLQNPSRHSVQQLYTFLENQKLPITEDGHFLGYKRVNDDWSDIHTGTVFNTIGKVIEMPRYEVDDDYSKDCSYGYHVGSIAYVRNFGSGGHMVLVKVNPRDAVAVPQYDHTKIRVCRYEVLEEVDNTNFFGLEKTLYSAVTGQVVTAVEADAPPTWAAPAANERPDSWDDESDDDDEDDEDTDDDDDDDEDEDEDYTDDSWDDESDDDDTDDEDEDDDDTEVNEPTLGDKIDRWADSHNFDRRYFKTPPVQQAIDDGDATSLIQYLYVETLKGGDLQAQGVLENPLYKRELTSILNG